MDGLTFDTSALIALEKRSRDIGKVVEGAVRTKTRITIPAGALAEWWRGRSDLRDDILAMGIVQPLDAAIAKTAGEALAFIHRKGRGKRVDDKITIDATVMATAALYGPTIYTGDFDDLARFQDVFPMVRILGLARRP